MELLMRTLPYAIAVAAISGLALGAGPAAASPLATGLGSGNAAIPEVGEGLVQKVHGWHCRRKFGWYRGDKYWHRHRRACDYSYDPYGPSVSFGFFVGDFDHDGRHFKGKRKFKKFKKRKHMY
jgi:hypothetical protein